MPSNAMKSIQRSFAALLLALTALWLLASLSTWPTATGVFAWRGPLIQYTGVLAMGAMSVAMVLAMRPIWLESRLHGLDKMYRLHKWLGIAALVLAVAHWAWVNVPRWLVQAGWLSRPARGPRTPPSNEWLRFLQEQRHLAEQVGEWGFYAAVALIALALVRRFPYRHFYSTHRWLAAVYLVLVWHSVVLLDASAWATPLGVTMAALMAAGTLSAGLSLLGRIGTQRKVTGIIEKLEYLEGVRVNAIDVALQNRWPGHAAGQFAFVTFDRDEGAHPFTISSAWRADGRLQFLIKGLGDYTRTLPATLKPGQWVQVEGPYGRFDFQGSAQRQIWVGGGIGISPFVARLQHLAAQPQEQPVDLIHCTAEHDPVALQRLADDAQAAGVRLHVLIDARDGRLTGERLRQMVPDWREADLWFCGPVGLGTALREDLSTHGLPASRFHQELFAMR